MVPHYKWMLCALPPTHTISTSEYSWKGNWLSAVRRCRLEYSLSSVVTVNCAEGACLSFNLFPGEKTSNEICKLKGRFSKSVPSQLWHQDTSPLTPTYRWCSHLGLVMSFGARLFAEESGLSYIGIWLTGWQLDCHVSTHFIASNVSACHDQHMKTARKGQGTWSKLKRHSNF